MEPTHWRRVYSKGAMLVESGNSDKVKTVCIRQIRNKQRNNGAWAKFYHLFNITDTSEFGLGYKVPDIRSPAEANPHTTAQAIYLLSLIHTELI